MGSPCPPGRIWHSSFSQNRGCTLSHVPEAALSSPIVHAHCVVCLCNPILLVPGCNLTPNELTSSRMVTTLQAGCCASAIALFSLNTSRMFSSSIGDQLEPAPAGEVIFDDEVIGNTTSTQYISWTAQVGL